MEKKAACGGICGEFVARWEQASSSWITRQRLLGGGLAIYSGRWPREGGMRSGLCLARPTSVRRMCESVSGFWLVTPTGQPDRNYNHKNLFRTKSGTLRVRNSTHYSSQAGLSAQLGGRVRPQFAEWMMSWPIGWTDSKQSATDGCHNARLLHSPYSGTG